jgi:MFS family permease
MNFFWWALTVRFITGLFQGLSPVSKASITEILPRDKDA